MIKKQKNLMGDVSMIGAFFAVVVFFIPFMGHADLLESQFYAKHLGEANVELMEFSENQRFPLNVRVCKNGNCTPGGMQRNQIALTFDDGPRPNTLKVLRVLRKYQLKATFFMHIDNRKKKRYKSIVDAVVNDGHILANHGKGHSPIHRNTNGRTVVNYLLAAHEAISPYWDNSIIPIYRNPGGYWSRERARMLNRHRVLRQYVGPIYWNVGGYTVSRNGKLLDAADWQCQRNKIRASRCAAGYYNKIMRNYKRGVGSLVLMHDIHKVSYQTLDLLLNKLINYSSIRWEFIFVQDIPAVKQYYRNI